MASGIAHYRWEIQVGDHEMDVIALHRVVKEGAQEQTVRTRNAIFLQHGDAKDFVGMFLPGTLSATTPNEFGAAIYWAERNMDVWGIDQAWNLVPAETEVFDFMANWGITKQARDLGTAVTLARDYPDEPSPAIEGLTNLETAMFFGAGPVFGVGAVHYLAGIWEDDFPVDFVHVTVEQWLDFMIAGSPWQPTFFLLEYSVLGCMETPVPRDEHFSEITIPVLNLGAAGGIAPTTSYCLELLGSDDITDMSIQLLPDEDVLYDFGHIDLWIADTAPELVWDPILDWVKDHTPGGNAHGNPHQH